MGDPAAYPLPHAYTLRSHSESNGQSYKTSHYHVLDLETIADWITLRRNLQPGSVFAVPGLSYRHRGRTISGFSLFRDGVRPEWEDSRNENGFTCSLRGTLSSPAIDELWNDLVVDFVRGGLDECVLGLQLTRKCIRRTACVKFDVWCSSLGSSDAVLEALNGLHSLEHKFELVQRKFR
jgi:translation initiation factor 4E